MKYYTNHSLNHVEKGGKIEGLPAHSVWHGDPVMGGVKLMNRSAALRADFSFPVRSGKRACPAPRK